MTGTTDQTGHTAALACTLFLAQGSPSSERARRTVGEALASCGLDPALLETVDVGSEPRRAMKAGAIAVPMLSVRTPTGARWYAGDFEEIRNVQSFFQSLL